MSAPCVDMRQSGQLALSRVRPARGKGRTAERLTKGLEAADAVGFVEVGVRDSDSFGLVWLIVALFRVSDLNSERKLVGRSRPWTLARFVVTRARARCDRPGRILGHGARSQCWSPWDGQRRQRDPVNVLRGSELSAYPLVLAWCVIACDQA